MLTTLLLMLAAAVGGGGFVAWRLKGDKTWTDVIRALGGGPGPFRPK